MGNNTNRLEEKWFYLHVTCLGGTMGIKQMFLLSCYNVCHDKNIYLMRCYIGDNSNTV